MISENYQNLFKYESNLVKIGQKKFLLNPEDHEEFAIIASTQLVNKIINGDQIFTLHESRNLIRKCLSLTMCMKIPTLEYIFAN